MVGDRYWEEIGEHWDDAARIAESSQSPITVVRRGGLLTRFLGPQVSVLLTGERGAGKTELFRALTGALPSREPGRSVAEEILQGSVKVRRRKRRTTFMVVPGQSSDVRSSTLGELFKRDGSRKPRGIIHVVSGGYDTIWGEAERLVVESKLAELQAKREDEISRLVAKLAVAHDNEVAARLAELRVEQAKSLAQHAVERARKAEVKRFRNLCENYLQSAWERERGGRPTWLIVAVTKFDLWYDERDEIKALYLPGCGKPTAFSDQLEELRNRARGLGAIAVVPVASYPTPWALTPTLDTREPRLDEDAIESVLNNFRNLVGEFCAPAK